MNLFVLSEFGVGGKRLGLAAGHDLRNAIEDSCDGATFIYPEKNSHAHPLPGIRISDDRFPRLQRFRQRVFKSAFDLKSEVPSLKPGGPNVLIVIGMQPSFLAAMHTLGPLLPKFDQRIAYIMDGADPRWIPASVRPLLDHLFVIGGPMVEFFRKEHPGLKVDSLPLAIDTLSRPVPSADTPRMVDVLSYGRGSWKLHTTLDEHLNDPRSPRFYHFTGFPGEIVHSITHHMRMMSKLLCRSKVSLCMEASNVPRFKGSSPLLYRWFEAWCAGCTVVGRRPKDADAQPMMDWENATIEMPEDESKWPVFFESVLADEAMLRANAERNVRECRARHDWRYRLRDLFTKTELPLPARLAHQISILTR